VNEQVEIIRKAVTEVRTCERRTATEMALHAALARTNELDRGLWHHTAIKLRAH
jgi:hypothetical protein